MHNIYVRINFIFNKFRASITHVVVGWKIKTIKLQKEFSGKRVEIKWNVRDELVQFVEEQQQAGIFLIVKGAWNCYNDYRKFARL